MKKYFAIFLLLLAFGCNSQNTDKQKDSSFTFVFFTDVHLMTELNAVQGFQQAIDTINKINPAFAIAGGDLIIDALEQPEGRIDSLYTLYQSVAKNIKAPIYNAIGNHEVVGWSKNKKVLPSNPIFGKKKFEKTFGKRYKSFTYNNWKFFLLDGIESKNDTAYGGYIDEGQQEWIDKELFETDTTTPIVIVTHIPLYSMQTQFFKGSTVGNPDGLVIRNSKEVLELFYNHKVKLILQGHLHWFEHIKAENMDIVTVGAIAGAWWTGAYEGTEESFLKVTLSENSVTDVQLIDYGWQVK